MMKNVKDALSSVRKIVQISCQFVQLHPNSSGTAAFFLALYLVCPFGFKFLTYAITMFYGLAIMIKVIANSEPYDIHDANKRVSKNREFPPLRCDSVEGVSICRSYKKPKISSQMSKRRNFKVRIEDLETLDVVERKQVSSSFLCEDNMVKGVREVQDPRGDREMKLKFSSSPSNEDISIDRNEKLELKDGGMPIDKGVVDQQGESTRPKELVAGKGDENLNGDELIPDFAPETEEPNQSKEGSQSQSEVDDCSEEVEDAQEDSTQAVEWTEDDQQNLTDLGLSEIERNRRLEKLIAKRRAKKSVSMKDHENFLDLGISHPVPIPPVNILKNPFVPPHLAGNSPESHLPGSAPSVLLPERNPFDLPYDSNEEKPNLMADSLSAEILAPHPKDILSRHESFFYGPSFSPGFDENLGGPVNSRPFSLLEKWNVREPQHSRFRQKSEKDQHDWLVEQMLSKTKDPDPWPDASENHGQNEETTSLIHDNMESLPDKQVIEQHQEVSSVGEDTATERVSSMSEDQKDAIQTSKGPDFSFQEISPLLVNVLSYENGRHAMEYMNGRSSHTSTFSIASDMQVEISGSSTPRTLADYNLSPDDAESSTHDGDMVRQTGFTNDEILGALSKRNDIIMLDLPEGHEDKEPSNENNNNSNNNMKNPFGSYISLMELDREEFLQRQQVWLASSPDSSGANDLEVRKARFNDPSNGNISESLA